MNNLASIEKITRVYEHPNADSLEFLEVRNCQVIVPKDKYKEGQKIVFIWPDSILPDKPWAEFYKAKSSRVRAIKLRGQFSMGIVEEIENIIRSEDTYNGYSDARGLYDLPIGTEISEMIGIFKYEPPPPKDLQAKGGLPFGIPKTDEENHYKFDTLPYGELCTVTRKIDGCLDKNTLISTEDGDKTIGEIVDMKYHGKCLSYDIVNKTLVYTKIINHQKKKNVNNWFLVKLRNGKELRVTGNHRVWINNLNCYRSVEDLKGTELFLTRK